MATLGAVVLAAGKSERMGRNKFLLPWGKGLAGEKILHTLSSCGLSQIVLILGFDGDSILSTLAPTIKGRKVEAVFNPHYEEGMISSVKTGVKGLRGDLDGFFLVLGDQPFFEGGVDCKAQRFFFYLWRVGCDPHL
ncbi:molybdenum cofactor cytidylyltransferase [Candidatus Hakubella thermalkaliphila]|nr:molybdenum cofactor cytidylyltransferase [Candidatus Hakubella thermalkaliphila]